MNYIVLDLEWNQSNTGKEPQVKELPFEIIDIGAVKLDDGRRKVGEYNQLVRPSVYTQMHKVTGNLIHLQMQEYALLRDGTLKRRTHSFFGCAETFQYCL